MRDASSTNVASPLGVAGGPGPRSLRLLRRQRLSGSRCPVAIHDGTWNYDDALIEGKLVEENGCLVLVDVGQGLGRVLPAFADDRVIWDPPAHVLTVHGKEFRPGTRVMFGGSGWSSAELPRGTSWVNAPPNSCRYDSIWGVSPPR